MAEEGQEQKKQKPLTFANLTALAQALDSKQAHTSFGKLPLSTEKTAKNFSFPNARRADQEKVFLGELTKQENMGKNSPGPVYFATAKPAVKDKTGGMASDRDKYMREDLARYSEAPKFQFGLAARLAEEKPKYDFYENALFLDDPINADLSRKPRTCATKIGTEPRMQPSSLEQNPGPQYFPKERPEFRRNALYTFGYRRGGGSLKNQTSTPGSVGPGRYVPEASANPSNKQNMPRWTLPKAGRAEAALKKFDKNQTYDGRSGFGSQAISKNKSSQKAHFGTSGRDHTSKLGTFSDMMQGGQHVKCHIPRF